MISPSTCQRICPPVLPVPVEPAERFVKLSVGQLVEARSPARETRCKGGMIETAMNGYIRLCVDWIHCIRQSHTKTCRFDKVQLVRTMAPRHGTKPWHPLPWYSDTYQSKSSQLSAPYWR